MNQQETQRIAYPRISDIVDRQNAHELRSIPLEVLANACIRGTKVHDYCTSYVRGLWLPEIEEEYQPYVDAFKEWADKNIHGVIHSNIRLYDDVKRFSGEFDMIVVLKDSKEPALIDLKTSCTVSKTWPVKLAAYKHLCELNGYKARSCFNLQLKKTTCKSNGSPSIIVKAKEIEYSDVEFKASWEIFSSALKCYNYFVRKEVA